MKKILYISTFIIMLASCNVCHYNYEINNDDIGAVSNGDFDYLSVTVIEDNSKGSVGDVIKFTIANRGNQNNNRINKGSISVEMSFLKGSEKFRILKKQNSVYYFSGDEINDNWKDNNNIYTHVIYEIDSIGYVLHRSIEFNLNKVKDCHWHFIGH